LDDVYVMHDQPASAVPSTAWRHAGLRRKVGRQRDDVGAIGAALFSLAADDPNNPFRQALDRWCGGRPDEQTLALIDAGG
jgi:uncharacterized protein (DUF1810 family)